MRHWAYWMRRINPLTLLRYSDDRCNIYIGYYFLFHSFLLHNPGNQEFNKTVLLVDTIYDSFIFLRFVFWFWCSWRGR